MKKKENARNCWIMEVDLEYPAELHKAHNSYPLAMEKIAVEKEWMSDYQKTLLEKLDMRPADSEKLLLTLNETEKGAQGVGV